MTNKLDDEGVNLNDEELAAEASIDENEENKLLETLDEFFFGEAVSLDKTSDFSNYKPQELEEMIGARIAKEFPDASIQRNFGKPKISRSGLDFHVGFKEREATAVVEVKSTAVQKTIEEIFRIVSGIKNLLWEGRQPYWRFYLVFCIDLTDSRYANLFERLPTESASYYEQGLRVLWPENAWPLLFRDEKAPALPMLSDAAIEDSKEDFLGFGDYAEAIYHLIDHEGTKTPLTLAINARWGMGKSSLALMIQKRLRDKPESDGEKPYVTYWFNAWMHDEANRLAAAFIAEIVRFCHRLLPWWRRWLRPLPSTLVDAEGRAHRRVGWAILLSLVALWFGLAVSGGGSSNGTESTVPQIGLLKGIKEFGVDDSLVGWTVVVMVAVATIRYLLETVKSISAFIATPILEANTGSLRRVREQLQELIREITPEGSKFVVLIDDLGRCRDTRAIDVLEVVNQLLCFESVVTVIIADIPAVATCAEIKYEKLAERYDPSRGVKTTKDAGQLAYGRVFFCRSLSSFSSIYRLSRKKKCRRS